MKRHSSICSGYFLNLIRILCAILIHFQMKNPFKTNRSITNEFADRIVYRILLTCIQ